MEAIKSLIWTQSTGPNTSLWIAPLGDSGNLLIVRGEMGFDLWHNGVCVGSRFTLDGAKHLADVWVGDV